MQFKRQIGAGGVMFASIGAMVGSGWLFSSLYASQLAGPAAIISWIIATFFIIIIALTFAELGTLFPIAGGIANYPFFTHGKLAGFLLGWISWLSFLVLTPIEVQATIQYMTNFFPSLTRVENNIHHLTVGGYITATVLMLLLVFINTRGVKFMSDTNKVFSIWKLAVPALAILIFFLSAKGTTNLTLESAGGFAPYGWQGIFSALAVAGIVFSFNGFQIGIMMAAETKDPQKNIPKAIIGSVLLGALLYILLQTSFLMAVPEEALKHGWSHLSFTGDAGPLAGLALTLGVVWLAYLLYVDAVISPLGAGIVYAASSSRVLYALSANGYIPQQIKKIDKRGIPITSVWVNFALGMLAFLPFPGWQGMVAFLSSTMIAGYAIVPICIVALREQQPNLHRPFRLPMYKMFCLLAFFICNLMLYWSGWDIISKLFVAVLVGFFIYFSMLVYKKELRENIPTWRNALWIFVYLAGLCLFTKFGSFDQGLKIIPEGVDYLLLAIFSYGIMLLSKATMLPKEIAEKNINLILSGHSGIAEIETETKEKILSNG
ncbi:APC family permease [Pigmentibacter sp. JX0631]|uniref:APC family permease n=1 Tax=Pigmentibacter sp. JX0631 TaxID=2976982 RepID=UPI002468FADF|nr:APC family permease [Pigmentibacter sp. JX0631]WGL59842.1 APC family permease [Pigmentibacter sp. JX0631]